MSVSPVLDLGPLRGRLVEGSPSAGNDSAKPPLLVVLLHGFGASGDDLVGLGTELGVPPGTVLVFPQAVHDLAALTGEPVYGDARAWWPVDFAARERALRTGGLHDLAQQVPDGLTEARDAVNGMLDAVTARFPAHRLVLGGFSQGAMLSLDTALRSARSLAGLVLLSGTIVAEDEWAPLLPARKDVPVFQSHGRQDPVLPFSVAERLAAVLKSSGYDVTFRPFQGPHTIAASTMDDLSTWLSAR